MSAERDLVALRPEDVTLPAGHSWNRIPAVAAVCAVLGAGACAILGAANPKQFFLPLLLGLHQLFSWSAPGAAEHDALLRWKAPFLNVPFFLVRAAVYFACWSFIALLYYRGSRG